MTVIAVLGAGGQVGKALMALLGKRAVGFDRHTADMAKPESLLRVLNAHSFSAVINAAAYTQVDKAESEEALAFAVNAESPRLLARFCRERAIPFVHYSTDYVFSGEGETPWREEDATAPLSAYGRTKLGGEQAIADEGGDYLIFRTSWVYDETGKNFLNTMLRLGAERETLSVVNDQTGAPTYASHLAAATLEALEQAQKQTPFPSGIYHLCQGGETTWHGFAKAIFDEARAHGVPLLVRDVAPIATADYPTPARRPANSRLDGAKALKQFGVALPDWRKGLHECMDKKFPAQTQGGKKASAL